MQCQQIVIRGFDPSFGGGRLRLDGANRRFLRGHIRLRLNRFQLGEHLSLADAIALLHQDLGNASNGVGPDVDVVARLDFSGRGNDGNNVLPHHAAGLHRHNPALTVTEASEDAYTDEYSQDEPENNLPFEFQEMCSRKLDVFP